MTKEDRTIGFFRRKILDFVRKSGREHLPWRPSLSRPTGQASKTITAYEVWVSEVMLQQTQVSRVIGYYTRFLERFPTVEDLARASWEEFLPYYAGLGYYSRGRNMLVTAQRIVAEYGGEFPREKELLMKLPGIGDYTASAILSFAHDEPYLAYDTNLKRVMGRFFFGSRKAFEEKPQECHSGLGPGSRSEFLLSIKMQPGSRPPAGGCGMTMEGVTKNKDDLKRLKDFFQEAFKKNAREMNAGLMDFGSSICTGRPKCATCPLASRCVYFAEGGQQEQKVIRAREGNDGVDWKEAEVLVFLHERHQRYFSAQEKRFEPFIVSASHQSRAGIKAYFREHYQLELAVRPPYGRVVFRKKPFLLVNAQILLGAPTFAVFSPEEAKNYRKTLKR